MDTIAQLIKARDEYYRNGESELTDDEYDALKNYVEKETGKTISNLSPPPEGSDWPIIEHMSPMNSMPYCATSLVELRDMCLQLGTSGFTSLKYDGLSIELQYDQGLLKHAVLRGDGNRGEDVYANVRYMQCVPPSIPYNGRVAFYGELVISWNNLQALNELREADGKDPYKSPRNAVAVVRSKRVPRSWLPNFRVRIFNVYPSQAATQDRIIQDVRRLNTKMGGMSLHKFDPVNVQAQTYEECWDSLLKATDVRANLQYQVDGLVFRTSSGECIKIKFPAESAVTVVRGIVEQLGRTGVVTPVIEFDPVKLVGADVKRATGHNTVLMAERLEGLGVGAHILVSRRGDVIPHVERVIKPAEFGNLFLQCTQCPSCGADIVQDGSVRRCSADPMECPGTSIGLIIKFCREMGIKGLGEGVITALMNDNVVQVPADLYTMDPDTIADVQLGNGNMGTRVATRICNAVWEKHRVGWGELLGSIGVPGCAKSVMEEVARAYQDPEQLKQISKNELASLGGIGPIRAGRIAAYIDTRWDDVIQPLLDVLSIRRDDGPLNGMVFCITLGLRSGGRTEMEARIRESGGGVKSSVSNKVTHVVCNQPDAGTSKLKRAEQLGIPVISEDELLQMMGSTFVEPEVSPDAPF